ncbi:unnamed protein product [Cladocopium goreaui]|uniref:Reticulocyte-binding protein 2-like a n=1 Tax=Cladocopium goreaui TaxID=2562237 RepID=A0A9P1FJK0_9DINO|nr:unnamed protein product [Cladocopium goreaui]
MQRHLFKRTAVPALLAFCARSWQSALVLPRRASHIAMAAESIPRGTPLNLEAKHVSVLSYNLLAPAFVRPIDLRTGAVQSYAAFEWVSEEDLIWENRQKKLLEQLRRWSADVVCLQEVQFDTEENGSFSLPAWLKNLDGYAACLPGDKYLTQMAERNERVLANRVAIGCAVLFRSDRLVQREETARSDPNRLVSACLEGHPESGIRHLGRTAFFSVHLDAQSEEERVEQLRKCLEKARALGTRDAVFAGDMNAECFPGSCVRAIISPEVPSAEEMARQCAAALRIAGTDDAEEQTETKESTESAEPTAQQLEQWKVLWDKAAQAPKEYRMCLQRVPTGPTRSAYDHGMSEGPCVTWSLDHIFYSPRTLKLLSRWTALEADPESSASGLPNAENPSDHLPVAALFEVFPTPCLEGSSRQSLLERLEKLEEQQHREMAELEEQLKALEPIETESQGPKGKKKDSPEMIAFKQEKRRKTKELKALQMVQRKDFWGNLSDLELDLVEESCGSTWIETGVRGEQKVAV